MAEVGNEAYNAREREQDTHFNTGDIKGSKRGDEKPTVTLTALSHPLPAASSTAFAFKHILCALSLTVPSVRRPVLSAGIWPDR